MGNNLIVPRAAQQFSIGYRLSSKQPWRLYTGPLEHNTVQRNRFATAGKKAQQSAEQTLTLKKRLERPAHTITLTIKKPPKTILESSRPSPVSYASRNSSNWRCFYRQPEESSPVKLLAHRR